MLLESFASCDLAGDVCSLHSRPSQSTARRRRSPLRSEVLPTRRSSRDEVRQCTVPRAVATAKQCPEPEPEPSKSHSEVRLG